MALAPAPEPEPEAEPPKLPAALGEQVGLLRAQLEPPQPVDSEALLRHADGALMNICEIAEVSFDVLNRVLALRTAVEQLAQTIAPPNRPLTPERMAAQDRALAELDALEEVLLEARPSNATLARGGGW